MSMKKDNKPIPEDSFHNLSNRIKNINENQLKREYLRFGYNLRA